MLSYYLLADGAYGIVLWDGLTTKLVERKGQRPLESQSLIPCSSLFPKMREHMLSPLQLTVML